ncbi:MAG: TlpA family protein disulfide reductase [Deltaproteobacteria bacterium]|nr:MAG: TlpA family protein disulfide reductase [Deltaproteobacteria bacterium]
MIFLRPFRASGEGIVRASFIIHIAGGLIFLFLVATLSCTPRGSVASLPGDIASLKLQDARTGNFYEIPKLLEKYDRIFLNFWGLRCTSCLEELRHLNAFYRKSGKDGVFFAAVNTDGLPAGELLRQMESKGVEIRFPVIADPDMTVTEVFANGFIPHNVVISRDGVIFERTGFNREIYEQLTSILSRRD